MTVQPAQLTSSNRKREETSKLLRVTTSSSNETSTVMSSLDPTLDYVISVSASTNVGESTNNINITLLALGKTK